MSISKTYIHLTGGLGNQLFQIAASLSRSPKDLVVQSDLGNPRVNSSGNPDITDFDLHNAITFSKRHAQNPYTKLMSKTTGYLLRQGMSPVGIERNVLFSRIVSGLGSLVLSIGLKKRVSVTKATDNGYCELPKKQSNEYLIGYFQSFFWPDSLSPEDSLSHIKLKNPSLEFTKFLKLIEKKVSLMVHVRLGDYKNESGFGIPTPDYYSQSISALCEARNYDLLVLFSNEPLEAFEYIPEQYRDMVLVAPDFSGSAAETLEAMRNMNGYIIGNSSLSWWGAYLSYEERPSVVCPAPWFRFNSEPSDLIPHEWIRINAWPAD